MKPPRPSVDPATLAHLRELIRAAETPTVRRRPGQESEVVYVLEVVVGARPVIEVMRRPSPADSDPAHWRSLKVTGKTLSTFPAQSDREVLRAILEATATTASSRLVEDDRPTSRFGLSRAACHSLFPRLSETGRFWFRKSDSAEPLVYHPTPFSLRLRVSVAANTSTPPPATDDGLPAWEVVGMLKAPEGEFPLSEGVLFCEGGFGVARGRLAPVDASGASSWLGLLATHRSIRITPARRAEFLEELFGLERPPVDLPPDFSLPEVAVPMVPHLKLRAPEPTGLAKAPPTELEGVLSFEYGGTLVPSRKPGRIAFDPVERRFLRRDAAAEHRALACIEELGVRSNAQSRLLVPSIRVPRIVGALLEAGFRVEAENRHYRVSRGVRMSLSSGVDWFDLAGSVDFGGFSADLPAVLAALRRGESTVVLGDGSVGLLPEEWLARHGIVLSLGTPHEGRVRYQKAQVSLLDALAEEAPEVPVDAAFSRLRADLRQTLEATETPTPHAFDGELRSYQRAGLAWLEAIDRAGIGGLLADEMGLGKTVQVLAYLAGRSGRGPALVVAPRSLVFNWKRESARFTPTLRVLDHTGVDRTPPGPHFQSYHIILTTYGTLRRDIDALTQFPFDVAILDEAQAIKNDTSDTARAARRIVATHRVALSGTPVENHLGELWSIMEFIQPGLLGKASSFKAATEGAKATTLLARAVRPLMLRRTKAQVAPDLPPRLEETWMCELEGEERSIYAELRARFRAELLGPGGRDNRSPSRVQVLEGLLRLRQAACHPGLLDPRRRGERSAKLDALLPELSSLRENGQKALVFSQFRSLLDIVRPHLAKEGIDSLQIDGTTQDREAVIGRFNEDSKASVLLISLKAGGVGLNLTAAEYVFLLDPWWNPAAEAQAIDRAHRIGQTKPVFAYRLIAKDTVEERIAELQQKKRQLADSVIEGDGATLRDLSSDDLSFLLS